MVSQIEHRRRVREMDILRHQIELAALLLRRGQQGKNLPAVIVDDNQHQRRGGLMQQGQRVEIVKRRKIADDSQRRTRAGALYPGRRRQQAVYSAGPAIAVDRVTYR